MTTTTEPTTLEVIPEDEPVDTFENRLAQMLASARSVHDGWLQQIDTAPITQQCQSHPSHQAQIDRDASLKQFKLVYKCPACEQADRDARFRRLQLDSGIPADVLGATITNYQIARPGLVPELTGPKGERIPLSTPAAFAAAAQQFTERRIRCLILAGTVGIGKGHLCAAIARHRLALGHSVRMITAADLWTHLHSAYQKGSSNTRDQLLQPFAQCSLLILDEIALKDLPADGEEILWKIFDTRNQSRRQCLFTTNQPYVTVQQWFGERVWDRLHYNGHAPSYLYGHWASYRDQPNDEMR